jgi:hypothetical protein
MKRLLTTIILAIMMLSVCNWCTAIFHPFFPDQKTSVGLSAHFSQPLYSK